MSQTEVEGVSRNDVSGWRRVESEKKKKLYVTAR